MQFRSHIMLAKYFMSQLINFSSNFSSNFAIPKAQYACWKISMFQLSNFSSEYNWQTFESNGAIRSLYFSMFQLNNFSSDFCWNNMHVQQCNTLGVIFLCFNWLISARILVSNSLKRYLCLIIWLISAWILKKKFKVWRQ